jgi:LmbE family N-acetylglucosaminyl deacetylase
MTQVLRFGQLFARQIRTVLCLGAHCDDIEIGAAGLLMSLIEHNPLIEVHWHVFGATEERAAETRRAAAVLLDGAARSKVEVSGFRNSYFPAQIAAIKDEVEKVKLELQPDFVLTHCRDDLHQDHRVVNELTWNAFRDDLLLEYEIPKYDGDLGRPNFYAPLTEQVAQRKVDTLMACFASQRGRHWFKPDLFMALMRLRGMECNAPSGLAEAFYVRKISL